MDFGVYSPDVREIMDAALHGPLPYEQISRLPLHTRCRLIRHMTQSILSGQKARVDPLAAESLSSLGKSFQVSDYYVAWHDRQMRSLLKALKAREHRTTLNVIRHWNHASDSQRREALLKTTRMQQKVFMRGIADPPPIKLVFSFKAAQRYRDGSTTILYGTFKGSLKTGRGRIWQNINPDAAFDNAQEALDTAHHEMDHAVHFSLAHAYHRGLIRPEHPLHAEARYFHAVEVRDANIPPALQTAYRAQTFEGLAWREGKAIAAGIYALAQ